VKHHPDGIVEVFSSTGGIAAGGALGRFVGRDTGAILESRPAHRSQRQGHDVRQHGRAGGRSRSPGNRPRPTRPLARNRPSRRRAPWECRRVWTLNWETIAYDPMNAFPGGPP
jgi:hypothetical protein